MAAELGLTQKELAEKLNISDRTVSKWERGAGFPDISLVEPLADALGLSVLELLHGEESPRGSSRIRHFRPGDITGPVAPSGGQIEAGQALAHRGIYPP